MTLKNVSATQVETYSACPRAWHFQWVRGFKEPPTLAMQRGMLIHSGAEHAVKKAHELAMKAHDSALSAIAKLKLDDDLLLLDNDFAPYVKSMLPHLPLGRDKVLVEQKINLPTLPGLPPWIGYIDLLDDSRTLSEYMRITDHKTTSDFRYAKTPEELRNNTQVVSYAKFAFDQGHDEEFVEVGHLYVKTATKTPKTPKVLPVFALVDQPQVEAVWARDMVIVEEMVRAAEITNTDLLEPKGTSNGQCKKYGGCPHRQRCGISIQNHLSATNKTNGKGNEMSNSFLDRVKAAKAAAGGAPAPAPTPAAAKPAAVAAKPPGVPAKATNGAAKPATGVLPPDAAPRTTPVKARTHEPASDESEPMGNSERIAAAQAAPAPEKRPVGRPKKAAAPATAGGDFLLFIDCMPTKNVGGDDATMFEDWIAPVRLQLDSDAMETDNLPDYRLLPYAKEKAAFAAAVSGAVSRGMPGVMIVSSSSAGAKDALDVLIPHARMVVKSVRG